VTTATPPEKPDDDAEDAIRVLVEEFRHRLEEEALEIKGARKATWVSATHVRTAYRRLTTPAGGRTDAQKLITTAFQENRFVEWTGYGMALVLFLLGVSLLVYAVIGPVEVAGRVASLVGGSVAELVLVIPLRFSINARRHNFALRILGLMLDQVDDPSLLADCIWKLLGEITPNREHRENTR
jgi:hypothetical protein